MTFRRRSLWLRRAVMAGVVMMLMIVGTAGSAWAWCEGDPPPPKEPSSGMAAFFMVEPNVDPDVDPGNPFEDPENVSLAETYGYPYHWGTYDSGCGPDVVVDDGAGVFTAFANFTFDVGLAAGAFAQTVQTFVYDGPLQPLDEPIETTQDAVFDSIWTVWFPVALMGVGVVVIARAKRAEMSENATILMVAAVVLAASVYFLSFPSRAADLADEGMGAAVETATSPFGGSADIDEQMARSIYYPAWLEGSFGSADSAVAEKHGPALFASMHYTWVEWERINQGGLEAKVQIDAIKGAAFEQVASDLKANYPAEYQVLIGNNATDRLGLAAITSAYAASAAFVVVVGMGLILLAMLIIRAFIIAFPLAGMAGVFPQGRAILIKLWDYLAAALWCVVKLAFVTGLFLVLSGALLTADMPSVMKFIVLIVMTIAVLMFARPFRTAKSMLPGLDPYHSYGRGSFDRMRNWRANRKEAKKEAEEDEDKKAEDASTADTPGHERPVSRPEEESLPPLEPPVITYSVSDAGHEEVDSTHTMTVTDRDPPNPYVTAFTYDEDGFPIQDTTGPAGRPDRATAATARQGRSPSNGVSPWSAGSTGVPAGAASASFADRDQGPMAASNGHAPGVNGGGHDAGAPHTDGAGSPGRPGDVEAGHGAPVDGVMVNGIVVNGRHGTRTPGEEDLGGGDSDRVGSNEGDPTDAAASDVTGRPDLAHETDHRTPPTPGHQRSEHVVTSRSAPDAAAVPRQTRSGGSAPGDTSGTDLPASTPAPAGGTNHHSGNGHDTGNGHDSRTGGHSTTASNSGAGNSGAGHQSGRGHQPGTGGGGVPPGGGESASRSAKPRRQRFVPMDVHVDPVYRSGGHRADLYGEAMTVGHVEPVVAQPVLDSAGNERFLIYSRDDRI